MSGAVVAGLAILIALALRGRRAEGRTVTTSIPGGTQTERARVLLDRWGEAIRAYPSPMPPGALALVMLRESGGNARALAPRTTEAFWECGLLQLVVEVESGRGEAKTYDVDPWHGPSNIYAAQRSYAADYEFLREKLAEAERPLAEDDPVDSAVALMGLSRSIGRAAVVTLAVRTPELWAGSGTVHGWAALLAARPELLPAQLGVQSRAKLQERLRRWSKFPAEARQVEGFPARLEGPKERGAEVKAWPIAGAIDTPAERVRLKRWIESKGTIAP